MPRYAINSSSEYEVLSADNKIPVVDGISVRDGKIDLEDSINGIYNKLDVKGMAEKNGDGKIHQSEINFMKKYFANSADKFIFEIDSSRPDRARVVNGQEATYVNVKLTLGDYRPAEDEYAILLALKYGPPVGVTISPDFRDFFGYIRFGVLHRAGIIDAFLRTVKYITTKRVTPGKRGRPKKSDVKYVNPQTGRLIQQGKPTWKRLYGSVLLKKAEYKNLNDLDNIEYVVPDKKNCAKTFIQNEYGKKYADKLPSQPTYVDILDALKDKVNVYVYDRVTNLIDYCRNKDNDKSLHFMIHTSHMYVLNLWEEKKKDVVLLKQNSKFNVSKAISKIQSSTDTTFVLTEYKHYESILNYIKKSYEAGSYSGMCVKFKSNEIRYDARYEDFIRYAEAHGSKSFNMFTLINSYFDLIGCMNVDTFNIMSSDNHILYADEHEEGKKYGITVKFDINKSYPSVFYNYRLPRPDINDHIIEYDDSDKIESQWFYYIVTNKPHPLLAAKNGFYYGYLVKAMNAHDKNCTKENKIIKKIKYVLQCTHHETIEDEYLPNKDGTPKSSGKSFSFQYLREYTGWLRTFVINDTKTYDNLTDTEINALSAYHETVQTKFSRGENKSVTIQTSRTKMKHGLLAYMAITQLNNLELYRFDKSIRELNKHVELVTIKTDCLGYRFKDDKYNLPEHLMGSEAGKFKIVDTDEKKTYITKNTQCLIDRTKKCKAEVELNLDCKLRKLKKLSTSKIHELIDDNKSFILEGPAGVGKTNTVLCDILPYLKENDMNYILCSTTLEQGYDFHLKVEQKYGKIKGEQPVHRNIKEYRYNLFRDRKIEKTKNKNTLLGRHTEYVKTFQSLFDKKSDTEIVSNFDDVDYLIIDEAVQLSECDMAKLQILTSISKCKLIALSDKRQCKVGSWNNAPYIDTPIAHKLFDYNSVEMKYGEKSRFDTEMLEIVKYILANYDDREKVCTYLEKKFKSVRKSSSFALAYTHKHRRSLEEKYSAKKTNTVHSAQGKTLTEKYTLYKIRSMPMDVLYTGVTRASTKSQIVLFDPDNKKSDDSDSDSSSDSDD